MPRTGGDGGEVTALANVASSDLETESRMRTTNGLCHRVKTVKGIVGDGDVQGRQQGLFEGRGGSVRGQAAERIDIGRDVSQIIHALIKASMSCSLDESRFDVKVIQDRESVRVPKENTKSGIGNDAPISSSSGSDMDATTKSTQLG